MSLPVLGLQQRNLLQLVTAFWKRNPRTKNISLGIFGTADQNKKYYF